MEQVLASLIKEIFVVMGAPDTPVRQCSLAMNKWEKLQVAPIQTMLGLVIDTNKMTVSVPNDYIQSVYLLIDSTWHTYHQRFTVKEAQELTRKLGHLAKGANWVFHLLTHLYASIVYAFLRTRDSWKTLLQSSKPLLNCYGQATSSAMLKTRSATFHMPQNALLNWCINPGVSTTSPNQWAKR
jgi:hypothetical protein